MTVKTYMTLCGWFGTLNILAAYGLLTGDIIQAGPVYLLINLIGSLCLLQYASYMRAYPYVILNLIWAAIAVGGLI